MIEHLPVSDRGQMPRTDRPVPRRAGAQPPVTGEESTVSRAEGSTEHAGLSKQVASETSIEE